MLRVLHVIPGLEPAHGGPTYALRAMTAALKRAGCKVDVAFTAPKSSRSMGDSAVDRSGVHYIRFRRQLPAGWSFSWPLTRWILEHAAEYELLHVHALFAYPTLAACAAARRRDVPYLLRPMGTLDPWAFRYRGWKKRPYFRLIERRNLMGAAAVHATSPVEEQAIVALGLPVRLETIPIGIDLPEQHEVENAAIHDVVKVLFLARLHPIKGLEPLVHAVADVNSNIPFRLIVAGDGDLRFVARLHAIVERRSVSDRVQFVGFVSGNDKRHLLAQADVFVLPSYSENFGVAAAEAMAAGLPVIVSDRVGLATAVERAGAGLVVPPEPKPLASAVSALLENPAMRRRMGAAGRAYAETELAWPKVAEKLMALYEDIVQNSALKKRATG